MYRHQVTREGAVCRIMLEGELDLSNRDEVLAILLSELSEPMTRQVQLDMTAVGFVDSTALSALVSAYQAAQQAGRAFVIAAASPQVSNVLRMTGLDAVLASRDGAQPPEPGAPGPGNP